ncbi:MADS-box transcription factor PHERES 1-like [Impatiens glandulifera]|uniref:MADS-box transcription factor PHERES 1-like n=1 Tax=Impatiens glandulifera TaxID=253017 RepID=UPI001FB0ED0B|nr:MADS-box transcription factor PHERES 1-like [Impatiens glandulifera]
MRRGKVKLTFIENAKSRKSFLTKRAVAISKMASELEILCGVSIAFAFFNTNNVEPCEVFPSHEAVKDMMSYFMNVPPNEQKATTQDVHLSERITIESSRLQILKEKNIKFEGLEYLGKLFEGSIDLSQIELQILYSMNQVIVSKFEEIDRNRSQNMNNDGARDDNQYPPEPQQGGSNFSNNMVHLPWMMQSAFDPSAVGSSNGGRK